MRRPGLALLLWLPLASAAQAAELPMLLVLPLDADRNLAPAAKALDEMVLKALHDLGRYRVLGREELNSLLGVEKLKDAVGCDDVSCAAELGGALGAPWLVSGSLQPLGEQAVLSLRVIDTRRPAVTSRATARGAPTAEGLLVMVRSALAECFGSAPAAPAQAAADYAPYSAMMTALGRRMANVEYSQMLDELDRYEAQPVAAPAGVDLPEVLTYYRIIACVMLKRSECITQTAAKYESRWPEGSYTSAVKSYVDQLEDVAVERAEAAVELDNRLADIDAQKKRGSLTEPEAQELEAYAYVRAKEWQKAAVRFEPLVRHYQNRPDKLMEIAQSLCLALEQSGEFGRCRALLAETEQAHPREFRRAGLHLTLRRLPK